MTFKERLEEVDVRLERIANTLSTNLAGKGVTPDPSGSLDIFAGQVADIQSGGDSNAIFTKSDVWEEADLPIELRDITLTVQAFNGALYFGSTTANKGVWKFDPATKIFTKILDATGTWIYFTVYRDRLYVASSTSSYGVYELNVDGAGFTKVMNTGSGNITFLEINDKTYVSFSTATNGLYLFSGQSTTLVYALGLIWTTVYVTKRNEVLIYNPDTTYGILKLNEVGTSAILIQNTTYRTLIKEFEDIVLFASSLSSAQTVLKLNEDRQTTTVVTTPQTRNYVSFYEFDGSLFLHSFSTTASASSGGVLKLNADKTAFTELISGSYTFPHFKEAYGYLYVSSVSASASGLHKLNDDHDGFTNILSFSSYNLVIWHEYQNEWYVNSANLSTGVFRIAPDGVSVTRISTSGVGARMYEIAGELFAMFSGSAPGVYKLDAAKTSFTSVLNAGYVSVDPIWFKGDLIIPGSTAIAKITNAGVVSNIGAFQSFSNIFEYNDRLYASSTIEAVATYGIVKLNEARTSFERVFNYGWNYTKLIGNKLVSTAGLNTPVFNLDTDSVETIANATANIVNAGSWMLTPTRISRIDGKFPSEAFFTNSFIATFTPVGDEVGNVFIPTNNNTIIFNTKPLQ